MNEPPSGPAHIIAEPRAEELLDKLRALPNYSHLDNIYINLARSLGGKAVTPTEIADAFLNAYALFLEYAAESDTPDVLLAGAVPDELEDAMISILTPDPQTATSVKISLAFRALDRQTGTPPSSIDQIRRREDPGR